MGSCSSAQSRQAVFVVPELQLEAAQPAARPAPAFASNCEAFAPQIEFSSKHFSSHSQRSHHSHHSCHSAGKSCGSPIVCTPLHHSLHGSAAASGCMSNPSPSCSSAGSAASASACPGCPSSLQLRHSMSSSRDPAETLSAQPDPVTDCSMWWQASQSQVLPEEPGDVLEWTGDVAADDDDTDDDDDAVEEAIMTDLETTLQVAMARLRPRMLSQQSYDSASIDANASATNLWNLVRLPSQPTQST